MRVPILWLVLGALVAILAVGVPVAMRSSDDGAPASPSTEGHAAILFPGPVRFFEVFEGYLRETAEQEGLELSFFNAGWSPTTQAEQLTVALSSDVDVVAIAAVDSLALAPAVRLSHETGVPLITFTNGIGSDPSGLTEGILAHVGRDELRSGRLLGEQIELLNRDQLSIVSIEGSPGTTPQRLRNQGLVEVIERHPGWNLVAEEPVEDWSVSEVARRVDVLLAREIPIDVIATQWADAAVAVADALERNNRDDIAVVTLEFTETVREQMLDGRIHSTSLASIKEEADLTARTALATARGNQEPGFIEVDQIILDQDAARAATPEW